MRNISPRHNQREFIEDVVSNGPDLAYPGSRRTRTSPGSTINVQQELRIGECKPYWRIAFLIPGSLGIHCVINQMVCYAVPLPFVPYDGVRYISGRFATQLQQLEYVCGNPFEWDLKRRVCERRPAGSNLRQWSAIRDDANPHR